MKTAQEYIDEIENIVKSERYAIKIKELLSRLSSIIDNLESNNTELTSRNSNLLTQYSSLEEKLEKIFIPDRRYLALKYKNPKPGYEFMLFCPACWNERRSEIAVQKDVNGVPLYHISCPACKWQVENPDHPSESVYEFAQDGLDISFQ